MAGGQESTVSQGSLSNSNTLRLRSRKAGVGTASASLSGQAVTPVQGAFGQVRTRALLGSAISAAQQALSLSATNSAPTLTASITDIIIERGATQSIAGHFTDADGDAMTFGLASGTLPSGLTLGANGLFSASSTATTGDAGLFTVYADDGQGDATSPPPEGTAQITRQSVDMSDLLVFQNYHEEGGRYQRWQDMTELNGSSVLVRFHRINITPGGGATINLAADTYNLAMNGSVVSTLVHSSTTTPRADFTLDLTPLADGWHKFTIEQVGKPSQSAIPHWMFVNKAGGAAPEHSLLPVVSGAYDLTHPENWDYTEALVPNIYSPTIMPLPVRECPAFSTAASDEYLSLYRTNMTTNRPDTNIHRMSRNANGVTGSFNLQNYEWQDFIRKYPKLHLLDGERGAATVVGPTHIMLDRHGGAYCTDFWRVFRVSPTGTVTTRAGWRHEAPPPHYQHAEVASANNLTLVGDWSAIPVERHGFHEIWGGAFDRNSVAQANLDQSAPVQVNPITGALEHPHSIGPRLFIPDSQNGRVCLLTFQRDDFDAEPAVTEFLTGLLDPWDCVWDNDVLYVSERGSHRINAYNALTGAFIRTVVSGAALAHVTFDRFVRRDGTIDAILAEDVVSPEGLYIQDGWLYYGSLAMQQVRKVNLTTGEIVVVLSIDVPPGSGEAGYGHPDDGQSAFIKIAISDGTFGPRGTVFTNTWTNNNFGYPRAWLPNTPAAGGTNMTQWFFQNYIGAIYEGKGGFWSALGYASGMGVGNGRLYCGSSEEGLVRISKALPGDPTLDVTRYFTGRDLYATRGYRMIYGDIGFGFFGIGLPWGEHADIDYFLQWHGHTPP